MIGGVLVGVLALLAVWVLAGIVPTLGIEEPSYRVLEERDGYELRRYEPRLEVEARVRGGYEESLGRGFRVLFRYISGENQGSAKIAMTAPVLHQDEEDGGGAAAHRVAFVLPSRVRQRGAPLPREADVRIVQVEEHTAAALRFSGYATERRTAEKRSELLARVRRDGLRIAGPARLAQHNPPWTPPFLRRNEILLPVE